jgi:hypothetical protein
MEIMEKINEKISNIKDKGLELEREVRERTLGYILTSFGLVAGLAWNEAIKAAIERYFSEPGNGLKAKFLYAVLMTVVVVIVSLYLSRIFKVKKPEKKMVLEVSEAKSNKNEK